ncbi:MAG TPA: Calx-beta domain-containing protein, partial [Verrucomicrobiota bacterium]|nr:Calx-beta domain-containing protein [Verrucomicrobiota bacterium]HQL80311.1 Calx-beta domain-containing protein [Verrucomicrobiota bacterium]
ADPATIQIRPNHFLESGVTQAGGDRKIYLVDGNNASARKGLIEYNLGANAAASDQGTQVVTAAPLFNNYYGKDVARDSTNDWYLSSYRSTAGQASPIVKLDGDGAYPLDDDVVWSASSAYAASPDGIDINEEAGIVAYTAYDNGYVRIFDMGTGAFIEEFDTGPRGRDLAFDAAGNMVVVDNGGEQARFWSPGGYTVATTTFDGSQTTFQVTRPPAQVSVTASQATVSEAGPSVNFTISRVGSTASALTVYYSLSGSTAANGTDFTTLSGSAVIPADSSSVNVALSPLEDAEAELSETVILTLSTDPTYSVVLPFTATISILDNENPEISFAEAAPKKLLESYAPSKVTHQLVRKGLLTSALTVNVTYSGTAARDADFKGATNVTVAAGAATANLVLTPINDQAYEGDETATANVAAGTGYGIGTPSSISATVVNDDPPPGTILFSDDFDTDSSALWTVNLYDPTDAFVDFAWDYSTVSVPAAPAGGGTKGLRMRCGNTQSILDGLSVSPLGKNFTGDYRLKFDMWINYNGPMYDGGPGSTQNFDAGVGTSGQAAVWLWALAPDSVWFTVSGDGASGYAVGDYNAMIGPTLLNDDSGVYAAGTGTPDSGIRDASNEYYSLWGGQAAPAAQLASYPNQTGTANIGNAGMAWHTVVITKEGDVVTWVMDGITLATVTNTTLAFSTNVFVGYQDIWAGGSVSDVPAMSFGLVDNLKVMTLTAPTDILITDIQLINSGAEVQISFSAGTGDSPTGFTLQATANLGTTPADVSATITSTGPGQFQAVRAVAGTTQFYRIRRN